MPSKPELISFALCPYVQRAVITLLEKGADFTLTHIDLDHKPDWFTRISPLGRVPVLRVGDAVVFESAVINEYLDETHPPPLHPTDPLRRAHNRSWIEFGSELLGLQYQLLMAPDAAHYTTRRTALADRLKQVEAELGAGPWFNGAAFSLVDAAWAPLFTRLALLAPAEQQTLYQDTPRVAAWATALNGRASVRGSVAEDFAPRLAAYLNDKGSYAAGLLARTAHARP